MLKKKKKKGQNLLLRNCICKLLSRRDFLPLVVGPFLLTFFGYKAQNRAEGEFDLRKQTFPEPEKGLEGMKV